MPLPRIPAPDRACTLTVIRMRATLLGLLAILSTGCTSRTSAPPLTIFNAAALGPSFRALSAQLETSHELANVAQENSTSLEAIRKVTELGKTPDILATADLALFDSLIVPRYASWYMAFGTGALVLAYGPRSTLATTVSESTWVQVLLTPGVRVGRSDPTTDPSGYRTLMAAQLAERFYHRPGLEAALLGAMPDLYVRRTEADLSALVEAGELDYIWTYRNLAKAHGLRWVELPAEVNLEDPALRSWYGQVSVMLPGPPTGHPLRVTGAPIVSGLTIPTDAASPVAAERFVTRLLSPTGRELMHNARFTMLPAPYFVGEQVPADIRQAATQK